MKNYVLLFLLFCSNSALAQAITMQHVNYNQSKLHIIDISPSKATLKIAKAVKNGVGRENVLSIAERESAIAAINGSYFEANGKLNGIPAFMVKADNQIFVAHKKYNIAYITKDNKLKIAQITPDPKIHIGNATLSCVINMPQHKDSLTIYTNAYHKSTLSNPGTLELTVIEDKVTKISNAGDADIPQNGFVISATQLNSKLRQVKIVTTARLDYGLPAEVSNSDFVISGSDILLSESNIPKSLDNDGDFYKLPYARSAICKMKNDHIGLFAVDNAINNSLKNMTMSEMLKFFNNKGYNRDKLLDMNLKELHKLYYKLNEGSIKSIGLSLKDFALALQKHGCTDAINLDGGASTTMVFKNKVISVSGPRLTEVADSIIVRKK